MSYIDSSNGLVWKRSTTCGETEDVWDDRALIDAYDKAVKQVNQRIADKCLESGDKSDGNTRKPNGQSWHLGQYCRCAYSEDGIEYEAQIISINASNDTCFVKYIGYGNEEQKSLKELKTSLGKRSRKLQSQQLDSQDMNDSNSDNDYDNNCSSNQMSANPEVKPNPNRTYNRVDSPSTSSWFMPSGSHSEPSSSGQPIVPPPLPFCADTSISSDDESLASMLMSWYMSGYHTGYYRALKHVRHNCNKCNK